LLPKKQPSLQNVAEEQVLYLTTIGRTTGLPREIEIWFVASSKCLYLFAETGEAAGWFKNISPDFRFLSELPI